jgi:signal transduction histidine kinase
MTSIPDVADRVRRILIVDDERHNRQLLEVMLTPEGFHLQTAASGEEALAMVAEHPPDLILLDIMMPGMDGYQVAEKIKGNFATRNIPVIMVTALDDRNARMLGLSAGAEEFITKPVDRAELVVRVRNLSRLKASGDDRYSQMLEGEVGSRTADLVTRTKTLEQQAAVLTEQEQIRQDQMRFKDEFLSHVSHELRSPLTAIKQFTSILLGGLAGELNPEQRAYQHIVLKNIAQLQSMIDDLLEVTRLETGKLTVEPGSVSLATAVTDSFNTLKGAADAKGVTLSCDLPPDLPRAHADQTRLRQVLIILLDNAIKFTPEGGAVTVQARLLEHDPRFLLLEVSDTGCGINPEISQRIFERLYQVSERIQTSRKGLGLGLYICKELVTRQGGQIWVTPRPEKGTTFSFTLPVVSLNHWIAPLLRNDKWPAESVALVVVETCLVGAWPSQEAREEWSLEARSLLKRCFLPDLDVLLPTMASAAQSDRFFVAAFADDPSASILATRIRGQFERLIQQKQNGLTLSVTYVMLPPLLRDVGASTDAIVTRMGAQLEDAIASHTIPGAVDHE